MKTSIGYPDELMDDLKLEQLYSGLDEVHSEKYLESVLRLNAFITNNDLNKLRKPVNKIDWTPRLNPLTVNAKYFQIENTFRMYICIATLVFPYKNIFVQCDAFLAIFMDYYFYLYIQRSQLVFCKDNFFPLKDHDT